MAKIIIEVDLTAEQHLMFSVSAVSKRSKVAEHAFLNAVTDALAKSFVPNVMAPAAVAALKVEQTINLFKESKPHVKH